MENPLTKNEFQALPKDNRGNPSMSRKTEDHFIKNRPEDSTVIEDASLISKNMNDQSMKNAIEDSVVGNRENHLFYKNMEEQFFNHDPDENNRFNLKCLEDHLMQNGVGEYHSVNDKNRMIFKNMEEQFLNIDTDEENRLNSLEDQLKQNGVGEYPLVNEKNRMILKNMEEEFIKNIIEDLPMVSREKRWMLDELWPLGGKKKKSSEKGKNLRVSKENFRNNEAIIKRKREAHLCKIAIREHSRLKRDLNNIENELNNFQMYLNKTEKEMLAAKQAFDRVTNRINRTQNTLVKCHHFLEEDDDVKGFISYTKDQNLIKKNVQERQKLKAKIMRCRRHLIKLNDEKKFLECNLKCAVNLYRTAHAEHKQILEDFQLAANQMTERGKEICNRLKASEQKSYDEYEKHREKIERYNWQLFRKLKCLLLPPKYVSV